MTSPNEILIKVVSDNNKHYFPDKEEILQVIKNLHSKILRVEVLKKDENSIIKIVLAESLAFAAILLILRALKERFWQEHVTNEIEIVEPNNPDEPPHTR